MYVRAVFCGCRRRLEAEDDGNLRVLVREHMAEEHAAVAPATDGLAARIVEAHAYDIERADPRAPEAADVGTEEEEFGPEPY